jgi:hypothetical protein
LLFFFFFRRFDEFVLVGGELTGELLLDENESSFQETDDDDESLSLLLAFGEFGNNSKLLSSVPNDGSIEEAVCPQGQTTKYSEINIVDYNIEKSKS